MSSQARSLSTQYTASWHTGWSRQPKGNGAEAWVFSSELTAGLPKTQLSTWSTALLDNPTVPRLFSADSDKVSRLTKVTRRCMVHSQSMTVAQLANNCPIFKWNIKITAVFRSLHLLGSDGCSLHPHTLFNIHFNISFSRSLSPQVASFFLSKHKYLKLQTQIKFTVTNKLRTDLTRSLPDHRLYSDFFFLSRPVPLNMKILFTCCFMYWQ